MGLFDFMKADYEPKEFIEIENRDSRNTSIISAFETNNYLTEDEALKIPSVYACIELISSTIAQLPVYLYRENEDGSVERIANDYREYLLNTEPNEFQNAYNFKKNIVKDHLLYGVSYTDIERKGNRIVGFHNIPCKYATVTLNKKHNRVIGVKIEFEDETHKVFKPYDLLISLKESENGVTGKGALYYGQQIFKIMRNENTYKEGLYENGALPLGLLKTKGRLTENAVNKLRESWSKLYSGVKNSYKTVVLEEGLEYSPISLNPNDLALNSNIKDNISDVCKLFNMPESLINSSANKYGSLEQNNIHYLQYTLSPVLCSIENALNKTVLLEEEKEEGLFWLFDTSEVLKTTEKEKYESIKVGLDSGVISLNEARYKLNYKAINDNIMKWSLGSVLYYPETGEMKIPNMGIGIGVDDKEVDQSLKQDQSKVTDDNKEKETEVTTDKEVKKEEKEGKVNNE